MTQEKTPAEAAPDTSSPEASPEDVVVVAAAVADEHGVLAEGAIAAQGDHALIVARFASPTFAQEVYRRLQDAETAGVVNVDGVLVVKADPDGRIRVQELTDHSTRTGLKWGIVGGVVAAVFLPATIVAGAAALGFAGAAAGKARNLYHRVEIEKALKDTITPGTSGILALVSAEGIDGVKQTMPEAEEVKEIPVDEATADAVKAAAKAAEGPATAPAG